jgi:hypothetical protein
MHHLGRTDRVDICQLIPVLRFQQSFGLDTEVTVLDEAALKEQAAVEAKEEAKRRHVAHALMATMFFGADKQGRAKSLDQARRERRNAAVKMDAAAAASLVHGKVHDLTVNAAGLDCEIFTKVRASCVCCVWRPVLSP